MVAHESSGGECPGLAYPERPLHPRNPRPDGRIGAEVEIAFVRHPCVGDQGQVGERRPGSDQPVRSGQRRDSLNIGLNSSTADFTGRRLRGSGSAASSATTTRFIGEVPAATATADTFSSIEVYIPNYAGATNKSFSVTSAQEDNQSEAYIDAVAGLWSQTAAITDIAITSANSVDIKSGSSFFLYGITKA